jgi:hypothetical protein
LAAAVAAVSDFEAKVPFDNTLGANTIPALSGKWPQSASLSTENLTLTGESLAGRFSGQRLFPFELGD